MPTIPYTQTSLKPANASMTWDDTYKWVLGWAVALVLLTLISKTRLGYVLIYYWLVLLIVFLLVTQYQFIVDALGPVGQPVPTK